MASAVREAALFSAGSLRYLRLRLWQQHRAEMVGFNAQRPVRLGVVILVRDMRRQLDGSVSKVEMTIFTLPVQRHSG